MPERLNVDSDLVLYVGDIIRTTASDYWASSFRGTTCRILPQERRSGLRVQIINCPRNLVRNGAITYLSRFASSYIELISHEDDYVYKDDEDLSYEEA